MRGDPQFYGFLGQSYQVHGIDGEVYSIISDATVQVNGRFMFLGQQGECVPRKYIKMARVTAKSGADSIDRRLAAPILCWSHAGSYIGELSVQSVDGVRLMVVPGSAEQGFVRVAVTVDNNSSQQAADEELVLTTDGNERTWRDVTVSRLSSHHVLVQISAFRLLLTSSDRFLNLDQVEVTSWDLLTHQLRSHGLLGQTWKRPSKVAAGAVKDIEGEVDDYVQEGSDIFGTRNNYNRFVPRAS